MIQKKIFLFFFLFFVFLVQNINASCFCNSSVLPNNDYGCQNGQIRDNYKESVARNCSKVENGELGNCSHSSYPNCFVSECPICPSGTLTTPIYSWCYCTTELESDSLQCVLNGLNWSNGVCSSCDSTKFTCETKIDQNTEQTPSDKITCVNGLCSGVTSCKYWSTYTTICVNECGTNATQASYSTDPIFIEGACDSADFKGECSNTKCTQVEDRYVLYQSCATDNMNNGELQMLPKIISAGKGTCSSQGFPNEPFGGNSSSSSENPLDSISNECLLFGACSSYGSDTTDYSNPFNRTSNNGCSCDDDGGSSNISRITCPDGSVTFEIGTCSDWNNKHRSSSSATPSSSSSAEGGGTDSTSGDWATRGQAEDIKDSLGSINGTLKAIATLISTMNPAWSSGETGQLTPAMIENVFGAGQYDAIESVGVDSVPTWADSLSIDSVSYNDRLDSLFGVLPKTNTLLDTLNFDHSSKCPVLKLPITTHWFSQEVTLDCSSLGGFDLCSIGSTLVIMMATAFVLMFQIKMIIRAFAGW